MTEPISDTDHRTAGDPSQSGSPSIAPSILIPRVLAGDLDAFEALYRAHSGEVYALCLRMSGDVSAAQELVQDVFVRAWERLASFRSESAFGSWLHRLAVNVVLENFRSNRRRIARITPEADLRQFPDAVMGSSPDERIDLDTAITKLPSGARMAFVLHDVEGYTHDEIATLTGLAAGTIRAQVFRARQLLMRTLS
ncbi:MAG: RNA polymerase sigma factor [Gemmatimonadaceae bacterium]